MHQHHEGDESVDPEYHPEHPGRDEAHEFEIHFPDQRARVHGGRKGAKYGYLFT